MFNVTVKWPENYIIAKQFLKKKGFSSEDGCIDWISIMAHPISTKNCTSINDNYFLHITTVCGSDQIKQ